MPDIVIVGAGAAGIAAAYELTKKGVKPLIIERDAIGAHASGFAFGGLNPFSGHGIPGPVYPVAQEGMRLHAQLARELPEATGVDTQCRPAEVLSLAADSEERSRLTALLPWLKAEGFPAEWLDMRDVLRTEPRLAPGLLGALRIGGAAEVDSYRYCLALAQAAEKGGATVRHGEVTGLRFAKGHIVAVEMGHEAIPCDKLLLAAGPWTSAFGKWLEMDIPVRPLKGQIVRLRLKGTPLTAYFGWRGNYAVTKPDGLVWAGTTEEEVGFDERPTPEARDRILTTLGTVFPPLMEAEIVHQTACLRPLSADGLPIVGPVPGKEGVFVATGAGRKGILLSPAIGRAAADLMLTSTQASWLPPLLPARFAKSGAATQAAKPAAPLVD